MSWAVLRRYTGGGLRRVSSEVFRGIINFLGLPTLAIHHNYLSWRTNQVSSSILCNLDPSSCPRGLGNSTGSGMCLAGQRRSPTALLNTKKNLQKTRFLFFLHWWLEPSPLSLLVHQAKETSQELRMLSRSLSDCKSLLLNVMIQSKSLSL